MRDNKERTDSRVKKYLGRVKRGERGVTDKKGEI